MDRWGSRCHWSGLHFVCRTQRLAKHGIGWGLLPLLASGLGIWRCLHEDRGATVPLCDSILGALPNLVAKFISYLALLDGKLSNDIGIEFERCGLLGCGGCAQIELVMSVLWGGTHWKVCLSNV